MSESKTNTNAPERRGDPVLRRLALTALFFAAALAVCQMLGWRPYASILSGSFPPGTPDRAVAVLMGLLYVVSYFGAIVITPICLIAMPVYRVLARVRSS